MSDLFAFLTMLATIIMAVIYWLLYKIAQRQVDATILASREQVKHSLHVAQLQTYLQVTSMLSLDREIRADRELLEQHRPDPTVTEEVRAAAFRVCAALNVAAVLANESAIPKNLFLNQYGNVMCKTAKQVESLVPEYAYPDFRRLTLEAQFLQRSSASQADSKN